jgi:dTDP-4-dehydrorhamnose reductase
MTKLPSFSATQIEGLYSISLDQRPDSRGWFQEVWQKEKWSDTPLSNFMPVQQNASFNFRAGSTRGLHAEPWNKLVTVVSGLAFCAWVDLREGPNFGRTHWSEMFPGRAYFVPKGVANGYQALEDNTVYTYLVDSHWSSDGHYSSVNLFDSDLGIPWPISANECELSNKDLGNPQLRECHPFKAKRIAVVGFTGQVGKALSQVFSDSEQIDKSELGRHSLEVFDYTLNAAAFTRVDDAEDNTNSKEVFSANHGLVRELAKKTSSTGSVLIHFSSDYVFDGSKIGEWTEADSPSPISKYGLSKLLGDYAASQNPRHYIIRTSWVFGKGSNFVRTMFEKAIDNQNVRVVSDQWGRPTSADDLAFFTKHLVETNQPYGTYNFSGSGELTTWYDLARIIYEQVGSDPNLVTPISTQEFLRTSPKSALRPQNSGLSLVKATASGFEPPGWKDSVTQYLLELQATRG